MSEPADNVEVVRRGFEAFAEGGVDAFLESMHPEFELVTPPGLALEPQTYRGHDGVRRYFDSWDDAVDEIKLEAKEFIPVGEKVLVPFRMTARGRTSGIEASMDAVQVWTLRDGKAIHADVYPTLAEAREAVG